MKILLAASEMTPFAKTGGLADVAGALPKALAALGHEVAVVLPFYGTIDRRAAAAEIVLPEVIADLPIGKRALTVWRASLAGPAGAAPVTVYLIEDRGLFNRPQLYALGGREYPDNPLRFAYFCQAAIWMLKGLGWTPDIIHANDWQTALIPTYLAHLPAMQADPDLRRIRVLFSIHNMSYQGLYPGYVMRQIGLPATLFAMHGLEYRGYLNLLKGGILYSHELTTVSPQYAKEIQTRAYGCGLEGILRLRAAHLTGIMNGIDTREWDPATDPALSAHYSRADKSNKALCKRQVQQRFGLATDPGRPLLAMIGRLIQQKGVDLLVEILPTLLEGAERAQFVLLGTGQPEFEAFFAKLARRYPEQVGLELGFDDALAHQIEAGADLFLMPSQFEPCGLNQLYSLRYGAVPVVRRTGGLADSITDATPSTIVWGKGTGFVFGPFDGAALLGAIRRALAMYLNDKELWQKLIDNGMAQDFSWARSAKEYEKLMLRMVAGV